MDCTTGFGAVSLPISEVALRSLINNLVFWSAVAVVGNLELF